MVPSCLQFLKHFGFPCELPLLDATATAVQCRVASWEARRSGGLCIATRAAQLRQTINESNYIWHCAIWHKWIYAACILQFDAAQLRLRAVAPTRDAILQHMTGDTIREDVQRRQWQRTCYHMLQKPQLYGAMLHFRRRLDRWKLELLPGRRVDRAVRVLQGLGASAPPRVGAAVLRTLQRLEYWQTDAKSTAMHTGVCRRGRWY